MTSKRIAQKIERERDREWNNGERKYASECRRFGWERVPEEFVGAVERRLGISKEPEQRVIGREQERLLAVAQKRDGLDPHRMLADILYRGDSEQLGNDVAVENGGREVTMRKLMSRYAPTK